MVTNLALTTALLIRADKGDAVLDDIWPGLTVAAFKKDKRVKIFVPMLKSNGPDPIGKGPGGCCLTHLGPNNRASKAPQKSRAQS